MGDRGDWTGGYTADIDYVHGYYAELNPLRARFALLRSGIIPPDVETACELGFGQGTSVNIHAAASQTRWFGNDFSCSQVSFANRHARSSGADIELSDQSFEHYCSRDDLPDFDYIGLHGVWTWISDHNRRIIVDFIRRKLKVGGVLYISYNTTPGWACMMPVRELMNAHAGTSLSPGNSRIDQAKAALDFVEQACHLPPGAFKRSYPDALPRINEIRSDAPNYVVHEYLTRDWQPMSFMQMNQWLSDAKLVYACSAHYLDLEPALNLSTEQQDFLRAINDIQLRETTRDFLMGQEFRRDYWVKGAARLSRLDQVEQLRSERFVVATARPNISFLVNSKLGQTELNADIYQPIIDSLQDYAPMTINEILESLSGSNITYAHLLRAITILVGNGTLLPTQDQENTEKSKCKTTQLNQFILQRSRSNPSYTHLASPVTGSGIAVSRFHQMFMLAHNSGSNSAQDCAEYAWKTLSMQGERIVKDGKVLESDKENFDELKHDAEIFLEHVQPMLKALGIP